MCPYSLSEAQSLYTALAITAYTITSCVLHAAPQPQLRPVIIAEVRKPVRFLLQHKPPLQPWPLQDSGVPIQGEA
jgi:hypothetical protein